jgi:hypothetical protein
MLVIYLWVIVIDVVHVFLGYWYRFLSCISGLYLSMLVINFCVICIDVGHVFVGYRYRYESCMCVV